MAAATGRRKVQRAGRRWERPAARRRHCGGAAVAGGELRRAGMEGAAAGEGGAAGEGAVVVVQAAVATRDEETTRRYKMEGEPNIYADEAAPVCNHARRSSHPA